MLWGGGADSDTPAARTRISETAPAVAAAQEAGRDKLTLAVSFAALLAALAAFAVALRK